MPKVEAYRPEEQEWWEIVNAVPSATFFHTPTWSQIVCGSFPGARDGTQIFRLPDGTRVLFPCTEVNAGMRGIFKECHSTYPGLYGGFVCERPMTYAEAHAIWVRLRSPRRSYRVVSNPFDDENGFHCPPEKPSEDFAHVLDLSGGFDEVYRHCFQGYVRNQARKAQKSGVEVNTTSDEVGVMTYFNLYTKSLRRWGEKVTWEHPCDYYIKMVKVGLPSVELRLAELDSKVIAGAICCFWGRVAHMRATAFDYEYRQLRPNTLLYQEFIRTACERGYRYFDLGTSAGLEGVIKFKESFGATRRPCWTLSTGGRFQKIYAKIYASMCR